MRYSLRNKLKIQNALGLDFFNCLTNSLDYEFKNNNNIIEHTYENEPFKIIHVNNIQPNTDSFFKLYIISKTFDVYNLAYKSCAS